MNPVRGFKVPNWYLIEFRFPAELEVPIWYFKFFAKKKGTRDGV